MAKVGMMSCHRYKFSRLGIYIKTSKRSAKKGGRTVVIALRFKVQLIYTDMGGINKVERKRGIFKLLWY